MRLVCGKSTENVEIRRNVGIHRKRGIPRKTWKSTAREKKTKETKRNCKLNKSESAPLEYFRISEIEETRFGFVQNFDGNVEFHGNCVNPLELCKSTESVLIHVKCGIPLELWKSTGIVLIHGVEKECV